MRRFGMAAAILLAAIVPFLVPWPSYADTTLNEVASALKQSPVYVAQAHPKPTANTAPSLQARLLPNDAIVLVLLPSSALPNGDTPSAFVQQLSSALGNTRVIGLGLLNPDGTGQTIGYAVPLPSGFAADQMHRSATVSTSVPETLGTFVQNVHVYLAAHPWPHHRRRSPHRQPPHQSHRRTTVRHGPGGPAEQPCSPSAVTPGTASAAEY